MHFRATPILAAALALLATLLFSSGAPAAPSAPLADIRTTPLLDNFNRANENPLSGGGNWAQTDSGICTTGVRSSTFHPARVSQLISYDRGQVF